MSSRVPPFSRLPLVWRRRLAVLVGGMIGTGARIGVSHLVPATDGWPWGTFAANISGALLLGYLLTRVLHAGARSSMAVSLVGTGMLGSYTTFSTFSVETLQLLDAGRGAEAAGYAGASVVLGFAAAMLGMRWAASRP